MATRARRLYVQLLSAAIGNSGLLPGLKCLNYPYLNCYSCPLAVGACPVGTIQHFVIIRQVPLFVVGTLGMIASLWGRLTCAWLCPFGLVQDLLHRLPWPGRRPVIRTRRYSWIKYVVLAGLVVAVPYFTLAPWFCQLCPAGTLEAALPWLAVSPPLRDLVGPFFYFKLALAALFVIAAVALSRPFCRFACPLGAAYGLANRFSRVRLTVEKDLCTRCGKCSDGCPMGLDPYNDVDSTDCIRCQTCAGACEHIKVAGLLGRPRGPKPLRG